MGSWLSLMATVPLQVSGMLASVPVEVAPPFDPAQPFGLVKEELDAVAERMRASVVSSIPALTHAAGYFLKSGVEGKRLRPAMLLMMATALDDAPPPLERTQVDLRPPKAHPGSRRRCQQRVAEIAEIVHVASLLHDDVIDEAGTRRGVKALNCVVGNKLAILAGDYLLARVSVTMAALRNTHVIESVAAVLEDLVSGEIMQMTSSEEELLQIEHYLEKTFRKTASLMYNGAHAVAMLGGHSPEVVELAGDYGRNLGLAFQIVDDVIDFTENSETLGKPALNDLNSGIATAPILFAAEEFKELKPLILRKFKEEGDVEMGVKLLNKSDGIKRARELAIEHAEKAASCIRKLPATRNQHAVVARASLLHLTEVVIKRVK